MNQKSRTAEATLHLSSIHTRDDGTEEARLSPEDAFPAVLATSRITALMELAAARLVQQESDGAAVSAGIAMNVTHVASALASGDIRGARARAVARHCPIRGGVAGRLHHIVIEAFDESGLIASAEHTRAIIIDRRSMLLAVCAPASEEQRVDSERDE